MHRAAFPAHEFDQTEAPCRAVRRIQLVDAYFRAMSVAVISTKRCRNVRSTSHNGTFSPFGGIWAMAISSS